jgi:hypothetical protein
VILPFRNRVPAIEVVPDRERDELRTYLGSSYDEDRLRGWRQVLEREFAEIDDEDRLYRSSEAYLYNLTVFAMSLTKLPYMRLLARHVPPGGSLLDYGCGIGSDGLALIEAGYRVDFADFENPSTRYLRWRLEHRGLSGTVYDLDRDEIPSRFDAAYAFDVIEHVSDPFQFLDQLESHADIVAVNFLEDEPEDTALHRTLPIRDLVARIAERKLLRYARLHDRRSHLLIYSPERATKAERLRSRARCWRGLLGL